MSMSNVVRRAAALAMVAYGSIGAAQAGPVAGIDFSNFLPAVQVTCDGSVVPVGSAHACDGSVAPVPLGLTDFRTEAAGDGSVRLTLINPLTFLIGDGSVKVLSLELNANPDPFINYSMTAVNLTSLDMTFSFSFTSPLVGSYDKADASATVTGTDARADGVTVAPVDPQIVASLVNGSDIGLDLLTSSCTATCSDSGTLSGAFAGPTMGVLAKFKLSPNGDSAAFNGSFLLSNTAVPAPPALALFALGALATAIARRRA